MDFSGTDYTKGLGVPVQNAKEGMVSQVGIEYTRDCAVQKDMENGIVYTDTDKNKKEIVNEVADNLPEESFDPADFISKSMTGEDAKDIEKDGSALEEYVASSLDRAIKTVKSQRQDKEKAVEDQVVKMEEEQEFYDEINKRILEAMQMASNVQGLSDAAAKFLVENDMTLSPANITSSSAVPNVNTYVGERVPFEEIQTQAESIIEESGMDVNEDTLSAAQWLYERDIPIDEKTLSVYQDLKSLENTSQETIAQRIEDKVMDGVKPEDADLTNISREEASDKLSALINTDESTLQKAFPVEADQITAKRQLEEIRLTMTIDAARTMENKGIHLDVDNLMQIVDELKKMEQDSCKGMLVEAGIPDTEQNMDTTLRTMQAAKDVLAAPVAVLGQTKDMPESTGIEDIAKAGNNLRSEYESASQAYEAVGTEVRRDLGDTMSKAFSNVDAILNDVGLPTTTANQRAVRILAYNQMPLTKENITSMKEYDDKVTTLASNLKPRVVTELIKRQENPLEMNLDELSEKVSEISSDVESEDISFRKYLWKLDHSGDITSDERKTMIGIYRLLDKVEKSDGAVVGQIVKEGKQLSFSSLLSAVRSRKAQGMDQTVDDDFGGLQEVRRSGESISEQISAAFAGSVVSKLHKNLSPRVLKDREQTYMGDSLEVILDDCQTNVQAQGETDEYYEQLAEDVRQMASADDAQIESILQEMNMPETLENIQMMKSHLERGSRDVSKLYTREESDEIIDAFDEPDKLEQVFDEIDNIHEGELSKSKEEDSIDYESIKDIARMAKGVSFYKQLRRSKHYEVPVVTDEGVTTCSVTLQNGSKSDRGTVEISVDSARYGSVQATFKVNQDKVAGYVTSDNEDSINSAKEILNEFEKDLEMNGFTMEREDFAKGRRSSFHFGDRSDETATDNASLYQVAKLFIQNVQRKEDTI